MLKTEALKRLEEAGIFLHTKEGWFCGYLEDVDLTRYLLEAGMFEQ